MGFGQSLLRARTGHAFEAPGLFGHPLAKAPDLGVRTKPFDGVPFAFQLFFGQDRVDLRMTRAADPDGLLNDVPVKIAFVFAIMMPCSRDEVVARERLKPSANGALSVHVAGCRLSRSSAEFLTSQGRTRKTSGATGATGATGTTGTTGGASALLFRGGFSGLHSHRIYGSDPIRVLAVS